MNACVTRDGCRHGLPCLRSVPGRTPSQARARRWPGPSQKLQHRYCVGGVRVELEVDILHVWVGDGCEEDDAEPPERVNQAPDALQEDLRRVS